MKIIDLLNKIANEEEVPKKIKYDKYIYEYQEGSYDWGYYNNGTIKFLLTELFESVDNVLSILNYEVEILEEKKVPEKSNIDFNTKLPVSGCSENEAFMMTCISHLGKTIDSLIDYLKSKGE